MKSREIDFQGDSGIGISWLGAEVTCRADPSGTES
jgi:hypothetical protein